MSRYIDADDAIYRLEKLSYGDSQPKAIRRAGKYLNAFANEQPADVEEVRHGRWKEWNYPGEEYVECSACFTRYYQDDLLMGTEVYPLYCPGCGARMDGGKE